MEGRKEVGKEEEWREGEEGRPDSDVPCSAVAWRGDFFGGK